MPHPLSGAEHRNNADTQRHIVRRSDCLVATPLQPSPVPQGAVTLLQPGPDQRFQQLPGVNASFPIRCLVASAQDHFLAAAGDCSSRASMMMPL